MEPMLVAFAATDTQEAVAACNHASVQHLPMPLRPQLVSHRSSVLVSCLVQGMYIACMKLTHGGML